MSNKNLANMKESASRQHQGMLEKRCYVILGQYLTKINKGSNMADSKNFRQLKFARISEIYNRNGIGKDCVSE